jgi:hypothetical protein
VNAAFFSGLVRNKCQRCPDGVRHTLQDFDRNSVWVNNIPTTTDYLVLNMGAWYSYFSNIINSTDRYEETLKYVLVPVMQKLLQDRPHLQIYWLDLPPFTRENFTDTAAEEYYGRRPPVKQNGTEAEHAQFIRWTFKYGNINEAFEWELMEEKNALAKKWLTPIGVHYLYYK